MLRTTFLPLGTCNLEVRGLRFTVLACPSGKPVELEAEKKKKAQINRNSLNSEISELLGLWTCEILGRWHIQQGKNISGPLYFNKISLWIYHHDVSEL